MKFIIKLVWFVVSMLIFTPVISGLDSIGCGGLIKFLVGFIFFVFVYLVPSNAFVSMYKKRSKPINPLLRPGPRPPRDALIEYRTTGGKISSMPAYQYEFVSSVDSLGYSHISELWAKEHKKKAHAIASFILKSACEFVTDTGSEFSFYYSTVVWAALYFSVLDILRQNFISYEVENQFKPVVEESMEKSPENNSTDDDFSAKKTELTNMLSSVQQKYIKLFENSNIDPTTKTGLSTLLKLVVSAENMEDISLHSVTSNPDLVQQAAFTYTITDIITFISNTLPQKIRNPI